MLCDEKEKSIEERLILLNRRRHANTTAHKEASLGSGSAREKEKVYREINTLYETLTGKISGKAKITLETYVQMIYFDQIIRKANRHFTAMSGGQYKLIRRKEATNLRMRTGLDLDVMDYYSGREREIKSLSGGEMFEASLSLALGLSDVIQENAGGISLEAMFIDEGFGTLDEEILEKAMKVLGELADGDRLVGIISHVSELEERIPCQVVVTKESEKGKTTSKIKVRNN